MKLSFLSSSQLALSWTVVAIGGRHFEDTWKIFDLLLRVFLLKGKKIATQGQTGTSNPDLSYRNLST